MNISYNWLKEYLPIDLSPAETAAALTSIGLETGSVEEIMPIKGGLEGLVVGHVLTCTDHPNSDHLHLTTVDVGTGDPLRIVCGASNVAAGQKVIVALIGTKLYDGDNEFTIKKSKIRGEESFGMICAEDEIGIGTSHNGIIVLPPDTPVGLPAKTYYNIHPDYLLEVDITPNRVDASSHWGVARDLAAYLRQAGRPVSLIRPSVDAFATDATRPGIEVEVADTEGCQRYSGITIEGVTVGESPDWLKNRLLAIGLRPINNIVDITNFVLHECGQPLHAFDADRIEGRKVVVRTLPEGTPFVTLDGIERRLDSRDLMICDTQQPMCIAGVFGGLTSGVTDATRNVFLESACFHPTRVRKTARRFGLNTDASFRFERGLDPNQTLYALKRAALLIGQLAGGRIVGPLQDCYPEPAQPYPVELSYRKIDTLIGQPIPPDTVKRILQSLDIEIAAETTDGLSLRVPVYRIDVRRDVDVVEEILRIYGYNNIALDGYVRASLGHLTPTDRRYQLEELIAEQLVGAGFDEIMNNSLTRAAYYDTLETYPADAVVRLINPLSTDLNGMRQTLLFGGLQSIAYNINHKYKNIRFFELGNCYTCRPERTPPDNPVAGYAEERRLGLWLCGRRVENSWAHPDEDSSVYELKAHVENIFARIGIETARLTRRPIADDLFAAGLSYDTAAGKTLATIGIVQPKLAKAADIDLPVCFAELSWTLLMREAEKTSIRIADIAKFPEVKRDLALLIDTAVTFDTIERIARECERKLLKRIVLFDVYEGKNLPQGKKSYAVSFYLQDSQKTLTDKQIDAIMTKIRTGLEQQAGAQLR